MEGAVRDHAELRLSFIKMPDPEIFEQWYRQCGKHKSQGGDDGVDERFREAGEVEK